MENPGIDVSITLQFATLYVLQPHLMFLDPTLHFAALYVLQLYIVPPYITFCSTLHFATLHCATLLYILQHFTFCGPTTAPLHLVWTFRWESLSHSYDRAHTNIYLKQYLWKFFLGHNYLMTIDYIIVPLYCSFNRVADIQISFPLTYAEL